MQHARARKGTSCTIVFALVFSLLIYPGHSLHQAGVAFAATTETEAALTETQQLIEQSAKEYDEASAHVASLEKQITENEARISELEEELPLQEKRSREAAVALYKMQQEGYSLVDMVLGAQSIQEFLASIEYVTRIQEINVNEINRLTSLKNELSATKQSLARNKVDADAEKARAEESLKAAQERREELQRKALEEALAQEAALQAALQAAAEKAAQENQPGDTTTPPPPVTTPDPPGNIDWSSDKEAFVNEWAGRIDAYLAGSPLAGQGVTFAEAAWNYGVDPRFSPAISNTESSKGRYCFLPYNAWGWGSVSWGSWEEAIDAHVRGLARGYGYTISVAGAQKYCPPNWEHWYTSTLNQMNTI
ncbi:MAG: hypothetical protein LBG81_08570 [Coriobacteriaceae bacterium]|jgi:peptidoglycan hydrolase CwlO-like protein|nr:hypothetical protein [Coriobacteriaceae bacterium]